MSHTGSNRILATTRTAGSRLLGWGERPALTAYHQLIEVLNNQIGPEAANFLAEPVQMGNDIDWYGPEHGFAKRFVELHGDEYNLAQDRIHSIYERVYSLATEFLASHNRAENELGSLLAEAVKIPTQDQIWLVDGQPVLVGWGTQLDVGEPRYFDIGKIRSSPSIPPVTEAPQIEILPFFQPQPPAPARALPTKKRRLSPLLLLPLLLAILALWMTWQQPDVVSDFTCQIMASTAPPPVVVTFDASGSMDNIMDSAKRAVTEFINASPSHVDIGMVVFSDCGKLTNIGLTSSNNRATLLKSVEPIMPDGQTALAESLSIAGDLLAARNPQDALIVVMTDGDEDSCDGDPGAVARRLKRQMPGLTINVVALAGDNELYKDITGPTGGKIIVPGKGAEFAQALKKATREVCR